MPETVTLVAAGSPVTIPKKTLIGKSTYFRAMFEGKFKESAQQEIEVPDVSHQTLSYLVTFMKKKTPRVPVESSNLDELLAVAELALRLGTQTFLTNFRKSCVSKCKVLEHPERLFSFAEKAKFLEELVTALTKHLKSVMDTKLSTKIAVGEGMLKSIIALVELGDPFWSAMSVHFEDHGELLGKLLPFILMVFSEEDYLNTETEKQLKYLLKKTRLHLYDTANQNEDLYDYSISKRVLEILFEVLEEVSRNTQEELLKRMFAVRVVCYDDMEREMSNSHFLIPGVSWKSRVFSSFPERFASPNLYFSRETILAVQDMSYLRVIEGSRPIVERPNEPFPSGLTICKGGVTDQEQCWLVADKMCELYHFSYKTGGFTLKDKMPKDTKTVFHSLKAKEFLYFISNVEKNIFCFRIHRFDIETPGSMKCISTVDLGDMYEVSDDEGSDVPHDCKALIEDSIMYVVIVVASENRLNGHLYQLDLNNENNKDVEVLNLSFGWPRATFSGMWIHKIKDELVIFLQNISLFVVVYDVKTRVSLNLGPMPPRITGLVVQDVVVIEHPSPET